MGKGQSKYFDSATKISQEISTIAPHYNNGEVDEVDPSLDTLKLIPKLLEESEEKLKSNDYEAYISLLQRALNLGSGLAAAKLGFIYLRGLQDSSSASSFSQYVISPDYEMSAKYYFLALKIINLITYTLWDMKLLLEVIVAVTELYRHEFDRKRDIELWNEGLEMLKLFDTTLNESQFVKFQTHENNQIRNAIRIHILFVFAFNYELDRKYSDAMSIYHDCEKIGPTSISFSADKLIKKSHSNYRLLQKKLDANIPSIQPICTECNFEPKDKAEVWSLLVCPKCKKSACCSLKCLQLHKANCHD